jgi:hypothetical protein
MRMLKLAAAWPISWTCFWIGSMHLIIMNLWDNEYWIGFWYPLYNDFMMESNAIQTWANGEKYFPWDKP